MRTSAADAEKAAREKRAFEDFVHQSGLPIDLASIQNRTPPEPDIICFHRLEGWIAFELVAITDENLARRVNTRQRNREPVEYIRGQDPTPGIIEDKLCNEGYRTDHPIELLVYTGAAISPDSQVLAEVRKKIACLGNGMFRRIWFVGDCCYLVWPSSGALAASAAWR
jgi:hypothetical protein